MVSLWSEICPWVASPYSDPLLPDDLQMDIISPGCPQQSWFLGPRGPFIEPSSVHPPIIDELKHCYQASGTPQIVYFLKAHDVSYPNSNTETNTKTNTETNTKTETNKGRSWDTYGVIYFWKGDDKRILNMICFRQALRKYKHKDKYRDKYKNKRQMLYFLHLFWKSVHNQIESALEWSSLLMNKKPFQTVCWNKINT